jgi:hypothetical protein
LLVPPCCSTSGYCGSTSDYCGAGNCASSACSRGSKVSSTSAAAPTSTAVCPTYNNQAYQDDNKVTYTVKCGQSNNGAVIGSSSATVNLKQCMNACDAKSGCNAALFQTGVNNCYHRARNYGTIALIPASRLNFSPNTAKYRDFETAPGQHYNIVNSPPFQSMLMV